MGLLNRLCHLIHPLVVLFSRKNPQQVFKGHRLPGLCAPMDVCGLYPGESHLGRFGR